MSPDTKHPRQPDVACRSTLLPVPAEAARGEEVRLVVVGFVGLSRPLDHLLVGLITVFFGGAAVLSPFVAVSAIRLAVAWAHAHGALGKRRDSRVVLGPALEPEKR